MSSYTTNNPTIARRTPQHTTCNKIWRFVCKLIQRWFKYGNVAETFSIIAHVGIQLSQFSKTGLLNTDDYDEMCKNWNEKT